MTSLVRVVGRRLHRVAGTATAALVATWLASGFVMLFVAFPRFTEAERIARASALVEADITMPPSLRALIARGDAAPGSRVRIVMREGRPVFIAPTSRGTPRIVSATRGETFTAMDEARALAEARRYGFTGRARVTRMDDVDQWTVPLVDREPLPFFRVAFDDDDETVVYLSARTGAVIQATTSDERMLAWLGPIPHWIYPTMLRRDRAVWRSVVLASTCAALVATGSGLVAGIRLARKLARRGRVGVRPASLRYHVAVGLIVAVPIIGWLASGAFSLSTFGRFGGPVPDAALLRAVHGATIDVPTDTMLREALRTCVRAIDAKALELVGLGGRAAFVCVGASGSASYTFGDAGVEPTHGMDADLLARTVASVYGVRAVREIVGGRHEDDFVYASHASPSVARFTRITVGDARGSVVYADLARAEIIAVHTRATRVDRWLFQGLHRWDPAWLRARPTLRYVSMGAFLGLGLGLVCTGASMSLARLRRWRRRSRA